MNRVQRDKLREKLEGKSSADTIIELIEQEQNNERVCPYCQGAELYRWSKTSELQQCYRCRHKDKWFDYEQAMVQRLCVRKAAIRCGITKNTSFKWHHRFLRVPAIHQSHKQDNFNN